MLSCRLAVAPQDDLGAPTSPSRMRSVDLTVVGEALADDVRTATPPRGAVERRATSPPVVVSRVETPPRVVDAEGVTSSRNVGATTSLGLLTSTPSVLDLLGLRTWSRTSLKFTRHQEVERRPAHRYLKLRLQARGCHDEKLTGIIPLGRMTGLKITRTCRPCRPALLPSISR
jgi:hypothetical protein